jgi:hypothetical protein
MLMNAEVTVPIVAISCVFQRDLSKAAIYCGRIHPILLLHLIWSFRGKIVLQLTYAIPALLHHRIMLK